ncbi:hypothetical protein [Burkholderia sp. MBR-1]|uniref:hypothetical protein n=1 Tax=Burkholderia sp. MBR-1 TaxID=2732364 RepID=UPI0015EFB74B|nr:hypothetical protein [Burkholderia sp. MBR-1]QMI49783.1 hypothetical protein MBR110_30400 [Burkholderia sp. MBR-1]
MSVRLRLGGVDVANVDDAEYYKMRALVRRDWRVHAQQIGNGCVTIAKAAAIVIGTVCIAGVTGGLMVAIAKPAWAAALVTECAQHPTLLEHFGVYAGIGLAGVGMCAGTLMALAWPDRFGFENKFDRALADRLARRYTSVEASSKRDAAMRAIKG